MSRGPGALGNRILDVLAAAPGYRMPWRELKERFPIQVGQKTFYRSIRSLEKGGYVDVDRARWVVSLNAAPEDVFGEELALARLAADLVTTLAKARGVPVPKPWEEVPDRPPAHRGRG